MYSTPLGRDTPTRHGAGGSHRGFLGELFTTRILIGLEFFVAAGAIKTILDPTFHDLIVLGSIVAIGTVLSYFLGKEVSELSEDPES